MNNVTPGLASSGVAVAIKDGTIESKEMHLMTTAFSTPTLTVDTRVRGGILKITQWGLSRSWKYGSIVTEDHSDRNRDCSDRNRDVPIVTGTVPIVSGTVPIVTGTVPIVKSKFPIVTGANPIVTGTSPTVTGTSPIITGISHRNGANLRS